MLALLLTQKGSDAVAKEECSASPDGSTQQLREELGALKY